MTWEVDGLSLFAQAVWDIRGGSTDQLEFRSSLLSMDLNKALESIPESERDFIKIVCRNYIVAMDRTIVNDSSFIPMGKYSDPNTALDISLEHLARLVSGPKSGLEVEAAMRTVFRKIYPNSPRDTMLTKTLQSFFVDRQAPAKSSLSSTWKEIAYLIPLISIWMVDNKEWQSLDSITVRSLGLFTLSESLRTLQDQKDYLDDLELLDKKMKGGYVSTQRTRKFKGRVKLYNKYRLALKTRRLEPDDISAVMAGIPFNFLESYKRCNEKHSLGPEIAETWVKEGFEDFDYVSDWLDNSFFNPRVASSFWVKGLKEPSEASVMRGLTPKSWMGSWK